MARPRLHRTDAILDATRDLVLDEGLGAATVAAIASASGAPTGSIYNRFGSRDELAARLWIRAVRRSQAEFLAAMAEDDPVEAAVGAALAVYDFCARAVADARLLVSFRREDLLAGPLSPTLREELDELNRPVEEAVADLARRLYGRRSRATLERVMLAAVDLPYGAARRHLISGARLPPRRRDELEVAVRAVLILDSS